MKQNSIFLCFDFEGVDGDTSEWGTQVLVEDFNDIVKNSHNVHKYNFYRRKRSERARKGKGGFILDISNF